MLDLERTPLPRHMIEPGAFRIHLDQVGGGRKPALLHHLDPRSPAPRSGIFVLTLCIHMDILPSCLGNALHFRKSRGPSWLPRALRLPAPKVASTFVSSPIPGISLMMRRRSSVRHAPSS